MTDFLDELSHSWGNTPKQKQREKEYNHEYYLKNKEKWNKASSDINPEFVGRKYKIKDSNNAMGQCGLNDGQFGRIKGGLRMVEEGHEPTTIEQENNLIKRGYVYYKSHWYAPKNEATRNAVLELYDQSRTNIQKKISKGAAMNEAAKAKQNIENRKAQIEKRLGDDETKAYKEARERQRAAIKKRNTIARVNHFFDNVHAKETYMSEIREAQKKKSAYKAAKDFVDGTVTVMMDKIYSKLGIG